MASCSHRDCDSRPHTCTWSQAHVCGPPFSAAEPAVRGTSFRGVRKGSVRALPGVRRAPGFVFRAVGRGGVSVFPPVSSRRWARFVPSQRRGRRGAMVQMETQLQSIFEEVVVSAASRGAGLWGRETRGCRWLGSTRAPSVSTSGCARPRRPSSCWVGPGPRPCAPFSFRPFTCLYVLLHFCRKRRL